MKKILIILLCLPFFIYSQSKEEQVVVKYSVDYKLPLMKRMLKKTLPKSYIAYYSENAYRVEFISSFSMLGVKIKIDGLQIENYNQLKSLTQKPKWTSFTKRFQILSFTLLKKA